MALRRGVYIVPTDRWYIERTVWLIAGVFLLTFTSLAARMDPRWALGVIVVGTASIVVSLTGFCVVGNVLYRLGFTPKLGRPGPSKFYFMQTDRWYLERRIYLAVGINISIASVLSMVHSPWWLAFTGSSARRWCGSPPRAIASWPTDSTGSARSRASRRRRMGAARPCPAWGDRRQAEVIHLTSRIAR
jgi:hypothetical protein